MIRRLIPSMFHRRLLLLLVVVVAVASMLGLRLAKLTLIEGDARRERAESVLIQRRLIPTTRGRILDRKQRVLAEDQASYDVCVRYPVLTGEWAYKQARRAAYRANRAAWQQLHTTQRDALIADYQRGFDQQAEQLWLAISGLGSVDAHELDSRRTTIVRRVKQIASDVWVRRLHRRSEELDEPVSLADVAQPIGEQTRFHPVLTAVSQDTRIAVTRLIAQAADHPDLAVWKQVQVRPSRRRSYPLETATVPVDRSSLPGPLRNDKPADVLVEGLGLHLLGGLRGVWKEDVDRRPYRRRITGEPDVVDLGGYLPGDQLGSWGIERSQEDRLRGTRGQVAHHLDTSEQERLEPVAGHDVVLSIDLRLQSRIRAVIDPSIGLMKVQPWQSKGPPTDPLMPQPGDPLNGAAVVLDVRTGEVLAAVSMPAMSLRRMRDDPALVWGDAVEQPYLYRVVAQPYQPGSTVKPIVLAAAITEGRLASGNFAAQVTCEGHLDPDAPTRFRCWIYKMYNSTHGPLGGAEAIARSCNIFFYTMGRRLGPRTLARWYDQMGLGRPTGCGLAEEVVGDLPDWRDPSHNTAGLTASDGIFMAIGQGPVRWTPLQAANAYAALARGGRYRPATFLLGGNDSDRPATTEDADRLAPAGVAMALEGLDQAANERYGSAHHLSRLRGERIFNVEGIKVLAKSGTAQGVPHWVDENGDRRFTPGTDTIVRRGDHAWVACMVQTPGSTQPNYVVVVVVEYGGSGGAVAGPVANQILHAMRAEGYL